MKIWNLLTRKKKISFLKETRQGKDYYYTEVNGLYVDDSLSPDKNKAEAIYKEIVAKKGITEKPIILEETEI